MAALVTPNEREQFAEVRAKFVAFLRSMTGIPLELVSAVIAEELTRMETAGQPWSPGHPVPLSLIEMHEAGLLPVLHENNADNG